MGDDLFKDYIPQVTEYDQKIDAWLECNIRKYPLEGKEKNDTKGT